MARIRTIKPEFWTDEAIVECSRDARLLFIGLWNFADDAGRMELSPRRIKMQVFPGDDDTSDTILGMIAELVRKGLLIRYSVDDKDYLQIKGWRHQRIDKAQPSKLPRPDQANDQKTPDLFQERSQTEGKGMEKEGKKKKPSVSKKTDRMVALPDDAPTVEDQEKAMAYWREHNVPATLDLQVEQFRAHHEKLGSKFKSWSAAWRTWYTNCRDFAGREGRSGQPKGEPNPVGHTAPKPKSAESKPMSEDDMWRDRVRKWRDGGPWPVTLWGEIPSSFGTKAPEHILQEFGLGRDAA